ncbi:MAG: zinc-ribbon domain-containing protein, partial [Acidobacteria bacterium]|nr:zinc-ribbon domain-containing protein [Acidobacteriota bacterium]
MALLHCPECGHEISTSAVACPSCGRPLNARPTVQRNVVVTE